MRVERIFGLRMIIRADEYMYVLKSLDDDGLEYAMSATYVDDKYNLISDIMRVK